MAAIPAHAQREEYERARQALAAGRAEEAAAIYRELSKADPRNADLLLNVAIAEYKAGRFPAAIASAESALRIRPDLVPARLFLGASYLETGDFAAAIESLEKVVAADPAERNAQLMLGEALLRSGRAEQAAVHLRIAADMLPANPRAWYALGRAYESLGRTNAADEAWRKLSALPPSLQSHMHSAEAFDAEQRWSESAAEWSQALNLAPQNAEIRVKLAWSLFRRRDYEHAMSVLQPLAEASRKSEVDFLLGASLLNLQQPEKAIPLLRDALALDPASLPARAALGQAMLQTGKPSEAIPLLESALATDRDGTLHFQLFRAFQLTRQDAKAAQALADYRRLRSSLDSRR